MATLNSLKKQIAILEAQVEKVTKAEMGAAINRVKKLMSELGVTVEHLTAPGKRGRPAGSKNALRAQTDKAAKVGKPPKYLDPASGATWSGFGRAPAWIAQAQDRTKFEIVGSQDDRGAETIAAKTVKSRKQHAPAEKRQRSTAAAGASAAAKVPRRSSKAASGLPSERPSKRDSASRKSATKRATNGSAKASIGRQRADTKPKKRAARKSSVPASASVDAHAGEVAES